MSLSLADSSASFADEDVIGVAWSWFDILYRERMKKASQSNLAQPVRFQTRLLGTFSRHVVLYHVRFSAPPETNPEVDHDADPTLKPHMVKLNSFIGYI